MNYPYQGRDLFSEPESYSYAQCDNVSYLENWQIYRAETAAKLKAQVLANTEHQESGNSLDVDCPDALELAGYLRETLDDLQNNDISLKKVKARLAPFSVKYEVFKRLHSHYDCDFKKHEKAELASLQTYLLFSQCLGLAAEKYSVLNFLSTHLKINDALSSIPPERFSPKQAELMISIIEMENKLIQKLMNST